MEDHAAVSARHSQGGVSVRQYHITTTTSIISAVLHYLLSEFRENFDVQSGKLGEMNCVIAGVLDEVYRTVFQ
jgi:hypothetical protein